MPPNRLRTLLAAVAGPPPADGLADAVLLARFADAKDEAAFEALVWRHGPMVRAVCRHTLGPRPEADDAFQATFLVLARKAHAVRARGALGGWLYTVAGRVARKLRRQLARREATVEDLTMAPAPDPHPPTADLRAVLDEEIGRLPEKYRIVVQLCYAAGHPTAEAARRLGVPKGTVLTRLAWARRRLQDRLARRGVTAGAGALGAALGGNAAGLDPQLVRATVRAAAAIAVGPVAGPLISDQTLHLSEGVIRDMAMSKLKLTIGALIVFVAAAGVGVGRWAAPATAGATASADDTPAPKKKADPPRKALPPPPRPVEEPPADREPGGDKYSEAMRKIDRLEKELEKLRKEAKRTAPVPTDDLLPPVEAAPALPPPVSTPAPPIPALTPAPADLAPPRPVDPLISSAPPAAAPTPSMDIPPTPQPGGKQFTVSGPAGTWNRTTGGHRFSLKFEGDRLTATNTVATEDGVGVTVTIDADFSVSRDGVVFGYITGVDAPDAYPELQQYADAPFSFRFRTDGGVLTIKDVKVMPPAAGRGAGRDEAILFVAGRYTDKPPPAQPRATAPPTGRMPSPLIPRALEEAPANVPPPNPPLHRDARPRPTPVPPTPKRPPADPPSVDDDPAGVPLPPPANPPLQREETPPPVAPPSGAVQYVERSQFDPETNTLRRYYEPHPGRPADPFRRPDGTSRLLGPGRTAIPVLPESVPVSPATSS